MQSAYSVIAITHRRIRPVWGAEAEGIAMLFDDLLIEANREEVRRTLTKIYTNRRAVEVALGGRPPQAMKTNWFSALFSNRNQSPIEYLEPIAVRVRND